ncbi:hypothetical protein ACSLVQ_28070, partial [Klebsiella pneumoniae]|uniref:hypothetical protein n=1 Tax=Klebsiella pneumoniae TaxID=573 RepID=UPI003EDF40AC
MIETLYCDMDGVLTDFTKAALNFHAISLDPLEVGWNFWEQANISAEAFWRPLGAAFWEHLPWTVEGRAVLANLREATG